MRLGIPGELSLRPFPLELPKICLGKIVDEPGSVVSADQQHGTQKQQIIVERPKYQALVLQVASPGISEKGNTIVIGN